MNDELDHKCEHEANIELILKRTDQIYKILNGYEDRPGLVTKFALMSQSLGKAWWWLGIISVAIMLIAIKTAFAGSSDPVDKAVCFIMSCVMPWFQ